MEGPEQRPAERYAPAEDGTRIGYDRDGAGEAMVLLAGQANSRSWWRPVRSDFAQYLTIALDYAGTGHSEEPVDGEWSTRRFARDVLAVLDHAGVARAHVYGTSRGAGSRSGWQLTIRTGWARSSSGAQAAEVRVLSRLIPRSWRCWRRRRARWHATNWWT